MTFARLASLTALLCAALCIGLLAAPDAFARLFGLEPSLTGEVMARRAGILFAPLFLILRTVRGMPDEPLRRDFARAVLLMMAGLALLGVIEWQAGRVGPGIFIAVAIEAGLAALFAGFAFGRSRP
ncbi:MAG: hypothetical protein H6895_04495 [Defluviimonas sp.]|uniref:hypothetical protein n=1 Tax=Albidovulum sp. TaxID=1872424 RepID=UPI001D98BEC0|nr:hypothetical protein [Paracoccaceae bacterium]MCC0063334.1 hypothetical protein [Defluviimonas sp.]